MINTSELECFNIIGHGWEILSISYIQELIAQSQEDFFNQYFTLGERRISDLVTNCISYFAGRFAAKAAVSQAIAWQCSENISWLDIEIQKLPTGQPLVVLHGQCQEIAATLAMSKCLVSISHTNYYATASAIAF